MGQLARCMLRMAKTYVKQQLLAKIGTTEVSQILEGTLTSFGACQCNIRNAVAVGVC